MKIRGLVFFLATIGAFSLYAQEIVTAERFLAQVSERYGQVRDYEARIVIRSGGSNMVGTVAHLVPNFMRIDFTTPANQVIVFNGDQLTIYLPEFQATLNQAVSSGRRNTSASLATAQGLTMMRRNYVPTYVTGPAPVPLDANSSEQVVKLRLTRRSVAEGFRVLILSVNPNSMLIRRIEGTTIDDRLVQFDFTDVRLNQGISEMRFIYDSPPTANMFNNFLFRDTD